MLPAGRQAVHSGQPFQLTCRVRRHDGAGRVFDNQALPQRDPQGRSVAGAGSDTDITDASQAHETLQRAREAADEASRAKSTFLTTMRHGICTPLNGVLGFAQRGPLVSPLVSPAGSRTAQQFSRILRSGQLLLARVNDVLDFS